MMFVCNRLSFEDCHDSRPLFILKDMQERQAVALEKLASLSLYNCTCHTHYDKKIISENVLI